MNGTFCNGSLLRLKVCFVFIIILLAVLLTVGFRKGLNTGIGKFARVARNLLQALCFD